MLARILSIVMLGLLSFVSFAQDKPTDDAKLMQGRWDWDPAAKQSDAKPVILIDRIVIKGDTLTFHYDFNGQKFTTPTEFKLNAKGTPKEIDFTPTEKNNPNKGKMYLGLYEIESGKLKICYRGPGSSRPKNFEDKMDGNNLTTFIVLKLSLDS